MKKDRKITTQGTGNDENKVAVKPKKSARSKAADADNTGGSMNEGNRVTADIPADRTAGDTSDGLANNNTTNNYAQEVDVNTGDAPLEKSPGATNKENNPSNPDLAATDDRVAVARSVDDDATKQTGRPTGAIYGSGGEIITVQNPVTSSSSAGKTAAGSTKRKSPAKQVSPPTKVYGQLQEEDTTYFIKTGNVPHGQLQLLYPKELADQMAGYRGQYVSISGELSKKNKADTFATLSIQKIVSHDQIGQRAYELSQQNPDSHEDNWLRAENELLST